MRMLFWCCVLAVALTPFMGCKTGARGYPPHSGPEGPSPDKPIVTLANDLTGKVVRVNNVGRFVVVVFPVGQLPAMEQRMNVIRNGLKVGELKITGPQLDDSVVADIIAGDAREEDKVTGMR